MSDSKSTTITAAEFIEGDYAAKIKAGECEIRLLACVDYILEAMPYSQKGWIKLLFRDRWTAVEESDKFTVTWLAQADSAKPVISETFDVDAFQHAIIDMHSALMMGKPITASMVNQAQKTHDEIVADLQRELSEAREQVARLRAALEDATRAISTSLELVKRVDNQLDTITFNMKQVVRVEPEGVTRAVDNIRRDSKNAVTRLGIGQQEAAAVLAGDEGGA